MPGHEAVCWIPLMDYAMKNGVSLSTLRRHIKANKVEYRIENGRYLLADDASLGEAPQRVGTGGTTHHGSGATSGDFERIQRLEAQLRRAHEEIAELKTLVALYEERSH